MTVRRVTTDDLDWMLETLAVRRRKLAPYAPVFWRPSADATDRHRDYLAYLLEEGRAHGYRTNDAVLMAAPGGEGWLVDDAAVPADRWFAPADGLNLWDAFAADCAGVSVRLVCPTYERERAEFSRRVGLSVKESWWLKELSGGGGAPGIQVGLPGADAVTVGAPPVYDPGGPILFLPAPTDAASAVPAAIEKAGELGCAAVVVNQDVRDL